MTVMKQFRVVVLAAALSAMVSVTPAAAIPVDLAHPTFAPVFSTDVGNNVDRSVVFDALVTFTISSAGIFFDPLMGGATGIAVDIFLSNLAPGMPGAGHGPLQATASTAIVDVGAGFYDVPISFTFIAGNRYDLAFRSTSPGGWGFDVNNMRFYNFNFFAGHAPYDVGGLVRVLDGACHGAGCGNYGNFVMPNVRFDTGVGEVVPEPTTLLLLGSGLTGLLYRGRRKDKSA